MPYGCMYGDVEETQKVDLPFYLIRVLTLFQGYLIGALITQICANPHFSSCETTDIALRVSD